MPLELSDVSGGCEEAALLGRGGACGAVSGCFARMGWAVEGVGGRGGAGCELVWEPNCLQADSGTKAVDCGLMPRGCCCCDCGCCGGEELAILGGLASRKR